jgi:sugar O-acyltransferase (sialic acid O-acetyltransferase NeuD family)
MFAGPIQSTVPIVGFGAGTHVRSVLEAIRSVGRFEVAALLDDDRTLEGSKVLDVPVFSPGALPRLREEGVAHAFVGVGGVGDASGRRHAFERLRSAGFELPAIVHAAAIVSPRARLGRAAQVLAGAIVNVGADIGDAVIVNTGAIVEHDCRVGAHAHVAPGARLAGLVTVGEGAHVGIGAVAIERIRIGDRALVAAGAVVVRDVPAGTSVAGVPAQVMTPAG